MDSKKMTLAVDLLFNELQLGLWLNEKTEYIPKSSIIKVGKTKELSEEEMSSILSALVAHGLILPRLKGAEVEYIVTEFGKYFFEKLKSCNSDVEVLNHTYWR